MRNERTFTPERKKMITRQLKDELVLYDRDTNRAFCLNRVAGEIWMLCDGETTIEEIIEHFQKIGEPEINQNIIYLTLQKLQHLGLLKIGLQVEHLTSRYRRAVMKKLGIAATMALPVVTAIVVPTPAEATSPCRHNLQPCPHGNAQCCSRVCIAGLCVGG
jgi:hypothetical protein